MQKLKVTSNEAGQRLDKLLAKYLSQAGKGFLYKMMRKKNITLNGKKCDGSERVQEGDEISLFMADEVFNASAAVRSIRKRTCREPRKIWKGRKKRGKWQQEEKAGVIHYI